MARQSASNRSKAPPSPLLLTLDVGTSSVRCLAFDARGRQETRLQATRAYEPRVTGDGGSELEAGGLLRDSLDCLREVSQGAADRGAPILGVGVCTFWHAFLAQDAAGEPLTPVYLWNDTRAAGAAADLQNLLDGPAVHRRTGCVLHPSYLPARLRWFRATQPALFRRSARFVSFGEYLEQRLTGALRVSVSMASGSGLFDQERMDWDAELLRALELSPERLSPLSLDHASRPGSAARCGDLPEALEGVPFFPALGDGACSNLGCGATSPRWGGLMVGTSAAVRLFFPQDTPPPPPGLWRYRLDRQRGLLGGAISNGGNLVPWLERTLRLPPRAEWEAALAEREPGSGGLTLLPFLAGERNPDFPLDATGALAGMRMATTPLQIAQAALESVGFRLAAIVDRLRAAGPRLEGFIASGGVLGSPVWLRVLADVLGLPLRISRVQEASSRGAALMALEALGALPAAHRVAPPLGARIDPDPARHERYRELRERHEWLYRRLVQPGA